MPSPYGIEKASPSYFRRIFNAPAIRALLVLSLIFTCCFYYAKTHFFRDPGSAFYNESRAFDRRYSAWREQESRAYLKKLSEAPKEQEYLKSGDNATICATFLTVNRPGIEQYLDVSIASALDRLTDAERQSVHFDVFFATTKPQEHSTFNQPWLRKVVDEVYTYKSILPPPDLDHVRDLENDNNGLVKAPYDYTLPLRHCEDTKAKYFALFEDDIILADGWLTRTLRGLQDVEKRMKDTGRRNEWLYMRLFNQERSTGWVSKTIGGNGEAKFSFWIGLGICVSIVLLRRRSRLVRSHFDNWTLLVVCAVFTPLFIVLFFQSGKASILPPGTGVREESFGCCAQGLVFNRHHVDGLVEYLYMRRHEGYHDMITRDYARMHGFARWSQYPMAIQHVGTHSTIQKIFSESRKVWSMAFEELDPVLLAREHGENVRRVFGDWAVE